MGREIPQDLAAAAVAERQHGNLTRLQLLDLGLNDDAIAHRVKRGRLHRVHTGVYAVGRPPVTALERAAAAVLACGPGAVLSHMSALALWGFADRWPARLEVTVARHRHPAGVHVHRCRTLTRRDRRRQHGIAVTSLARTLVDCAPRLSERALTRAVNDGLRSPFLSRSQLAEVCARLSRHPGVKLLSRFVDSRDGPTRSGFEDDFSGFCARFGLPAPKVNTTVCGYEVDALFEDERLIVELDGWDFHQSRDSFESDRNRDADTLAAGVATVRITWNRMTATPVEEVARLGAILAGRRAQLS
ncbi:MAG: hypothetical protein ACR2MK_07840 [Solirubrobacteraceae bacterium]